jgi:hypothetical protein
MNNTVQQLINDLFLQNEYDITSVGYGQKKTGDMYLSERSIVFGVKQKLQASDLSDQKIIPCMIEIDGQTYSTDVVEEPWDVVAMPTYCYDAGNNSVPPVVGKPVSDNRARTRPLSGGISGSAPPVNGFVNAGTLGGIVIDLQDQKLVGITNNHVGGTPGGAGAQASVPYTLASETTYGAQASAYRNIDFYQPCSWDRGIVNYAPDAIGSMKRAYPFSLPPVYNKIDACVVNLSASITNRNSMIPLSAPFNAPVPFATKQEIDGLTTSDPVFKAGRTTGSIGSNACALRVTLPSGNINVSFSPYTLYFSECIKIESPVTDTVVGSGGDSGSLVYACISSSSPMASAWKCIGLFFAGSTTGSVGYACRIDNIATMLSVSAWGGETRSDAPPLCSYITLDYGTYGSAVTAMSAGKTYWQIGRI